MGFTEFHREIKEKNLKMIKEVKLILWIIFIYLFFIYFGWTIIKLHFQTMEHHDYFPNPIL